MPSQNVVAIRSRLDEVSAWDIESFEHAAAHAADLSVDKGKLYLPVDRGGGTSPQFWVVECPVVGAPISYSFNGDSYPDGHIKSVSKGPFFRVVTSTSGRKYYRRRLSASWVSEGCWNMIPGHVNAYNREL